MKKTFLLLCGAAFLAMSASATTVVWNAAEKLAGIPNSTVVPNIDFGDVTLTLDGNGNADTKWANVASLANAQEPDAVRCLRVYFQNQFVFEGKSDDVRITEIKFTLSEDGRDGEYSTITLHPWDEAEGYGAKIIEGGGSVNYAVPTSVWTGDTNKLIFMPNAGKKMQVRFGEISVTYSGGASVAGIEADNVEINGVDGGVNVTGYNGLVEVYNTLGQKVASAVADGNTTVAAPRGTVIVRAADKTAKVIVR